MRIGIDIDNTITDTSSYIKKLLIKNNLSDISCDFDNYTKEELIKYDKLIRDNIEDIMFNCRLNDKAKEVIEKLYEKHKIYLITARTNYFSDNLYQITLDYLKKNGILYHELLFGYVQKKEICIEKQLDIMLDDNIEVMNSLNDTDIRNILFRTEHNEDYEGEFVTNWKEFEKLINEQEV